MLRPRVLMMCAVLLGAPVARGQDALEWLQRMGVAAKTLNYSGVFVYQARGRSETSRVTHVSDASGEHERLETLDGAPREVVRNNDEVTCYLPEERLVVVDRAGVERFPERVLSRLSVLGENYVVRLGGTGRIAGREAQLVLVLPRDSMRYGYKLWADAASGLLLKAGTIGEGEDVIEQFAYTEVSVGMVPDRAKLKPRTARGPDWQVVKVSGTELKADDVAWAFRVLPPGFRLQSVVKRVMRGSGGTALHAVFSDGLASVSIFIEQVQKGGETPEVTLNAGSTGMFRRVLADGHLVTALGEVPGVTLQRIAEGVEARKR